MAMTLVKLAAPLFGIIALLVVNRVRRMPDDFLGLQRPRLPIFLAWFAFWIVWIAISEVAGQVAGQEPPKPWNYPAAITAIRILAIGILGPIAERRSWCSAALSCT